jgi:hypothetical protein
MQEKDSGTFPTYQYNCTPSWSSTNYTYCLNSTNYQLDTVWVDLQECDASYNITTYPTLPYSLTTSSNDCFNSTQNKTTWIYNDTQSCGYSIINYTYSDLSYGLTSTLYNCLNSTNNQTTYIYNDTSSCGYSVVNYTYPTLNYVYSHLTKDCFNTTRVNNWFWFNDTSGCGNYYNTTNTTNCFVASCGDSNCSTSYQCSLGNCIFAYNETQQTCCNDCGVPDPFFTCTNNVLRERKTERSLSDIGSGVGNLFSGFGVPLMIFILLMALGTALGYVFSNFGQSVGSKV